MREGYELEVFATTGQTIAVVPAFAVRQATEHEVLSVREMAWT
jgi:TusA-related sulfurtransferase